MRSGGRIIKMISNKWGLLSVSILVALALVVLGIFISKPPLTDRSAVEVNQQAASQPANEDCSDASASDSTCYQGEHQKDHPEAASEPAKMSEPTAICCSGDPSNDFACLQRRYQDLVRGPGVKAAFAELKEEGA